MAARDSNLVRRWLGEHKTQDLALPCTCGALAQLGERGFASRRSPVRSRYAPSANHGFLGVGPGKSDAY